MSGFQDRAPRTERVASCPLCRQSKSETLFCIEDRLHRVSGEFTYRRCCDCRTVFQDPRVVDEDLSLCYPERYFTHEPLDRLGTEVSQERVATRPLSQMRDRIRGAIVGSVQGESVSWFPALVGKVLSLSRRARERAFFDLVIDELIPRTPGHAIDVGCGSGRLMVSLQKAGWEVEGIEYDSEAASLASLYSERPVLVGNFLSMKLPERKYRLVVLSHAFEHFVDPLAVFLQVGTLLDLKGVAVFLYPNPESLGARFFKHDWFPWEAPRHLVLPPIEAFVTAARSFGLVPVSARTIQRWASAHSAHSRKYRERKPINELRPDIRFLDRLFGAIEGVLVRLGFSMGEEIVVALKKENRST